MSKCVCVWKGCKVSACKNVCCRSLNFIHLFYVVSQYIVLMLFFSSAYDTSYIYILSCNIYIYCLDISTSRNCSSTLSGHPSSSYFSGTNFWCKSLGRVTSKVENLGFFFTSTKLQFCSPRVSPKSFFFGFKHKVGRGCSGHCKRSAREKPAA